MKFGSNHYFYSLMPNDYFQFKQFIVKQGACAMKVTTDACLFGAWVAATINQQLPSVNRLLDIGTGTGLLSLMLVQKCNAQIDAVEIDKPTAIQAQQNFVASPWNVRLQVYNTSIQQLNPSHHQNYNFIIANPPFFDNDLKSNDTKRNLALHGASLSLEELLTAIQKLLVNDGEFAILLPYHRTDYFIEIATKKGFHLHMKNLVKQTPHHTYFRAMLWFGYKAKKMQQTEIIIKEKSVYSSVFAALLKDYYLKDF